jgi:hypothetical protein
MNTQNESNQKTAEQIPFRHQSNTFINKVINSRLYVINKGISGKQSLEYLYHETQRLKQEASLLLSDKQFAEFITKNYTILVCLLIRNKSYVNQYKRLENLNAKAKEILSIN